MTPAPEVSLWSRPTQCLYCDTDDLTAWIDGVVDRLGFVHGAWSFLKCSQCGSGHLTPMPAPEQIAALYPPVYSFRSDYVTDSRLKRFAACVEDAIFYRLMRRDEVRRVIGRTGVAAGTLLDVGCGTGDRLQRFARAGFHVRGLEVQRELADRVRGTLGFDVDVGGLDSVRYPDSAFDLVTMYWVLEHLLDVRAALTTIHRILRPGGWLVAEVPLCDSLQSAWLGRRWSQFGDAPRHISIPSRRGFLAALSRSGFVDAGVFPSSLMNCAASVGLSLVPRSATMYTYSSRTATTHLARVTGGLVTLLYAPIAMIENHLLGRPAFGLFFARKPA